MAQFLYFVTVYETPLCFEKDQGKTKIIKSSEEKKEKKKRESKRCR